jgi:hypothetical protein
MELAGLLRSVAIRELTRRPANSHDPWCTKDRWRTEERLTISRSKGGWTARREIEHIASTNLCPSPTYAGRRLVCVEFASYGAQAGQQDRGLKRTGGQHTRARSKGGRSIEGRSKKRQIIGRRVNSPVSLAADVRRCLSGRPSRWRRRRVWWVCRLSSRIVALNGHEQISTPVSRQKHRTCLPSRHLAAQHSATSRCPLARIYKGSMTTRSHRPVTPPAIESAMCSCGSKSEERRCHLLFSSPRCPATLTPRNGKRFAANPNPWLTFGAK